MNHLKIEQNGKRPYTEKINAHLPSEWQVHSTFLCGDVSDPFKMYLGKHCVEKNKQKVRKEKTKWCLYSVNIKEE